MRRTAGLLLVVLLALSGCSVTPSDTEETSTSAPSDPSPSKTYEGSGLKPEIEAAAVARWTQNWCAARTAATGAEALDLMGPATGTDVRETGTVLEWQGGPHIMSITVDEDDAVTDTFRTGMSLSDADKHALDCPR